MEIKAEIRDVEHLGRQIRFSLITDDVAEFCAGYDRLKDKPVTVTLKKYSAKRSLDSNAYAWQLMSKIGAIVKSDKWDIYIDMLGKYGVFTHVLVKEAAVEKVKQQWREVKELGPITINGQSGIQLQCYFGSSTYTNKEMSVFIDGIVNEAKELGIETLPGYELERMKKEWGV